MSKEEDLMRRCIDCSALVNQQTPRYWVVYKIKYDFESGGWYSVKDLSKTNELKKYGTCAGAKKYALNLYHKYKKELGEDLEVCIKEELINLDENKKLKKRVTDLEAKLADLQSEQVKEMQEHQEAMLVADKKIKELEAKIAESEEYEEMLLEEKSGYIDLVSAYADKCKNYKQQLAEKETRIAELEDKDWYEGTIKQLEEQNERLIKQLAEKDKEILDVKNWWSYQYNGEIERHNQDKISFCIEQLEKVKELIKNMSIGIGIEIYGTRIKPVEEYIDNQIKQLTHQHEDKGE